MKQKFSSIPLLIAVILMDIMAGMEFDLFVPSFPEIQHHFNLQPFWVETLLSINFFGYCIGIFFVGGIADRYGHKRIILSGVSCFIGGTLLCLVAPNYPILVTGRFLQGLGVSAPAVLSFLIVSEYYPLHKQQSLLAVLNGVINISVGVAPVIGSYITLYFQWRWNFVALLVLSLITLIMTILFVPEKKPSGPKVSLSPREYIRIFDSKPLTLLTTTFIFMFVPYWVFVGMTPILFRKDLGISLEHFGYYQGSLAFLFALGSFVCGAVINMYDHKKILKFANWVFALGILTVGMATFWDSRSPLMIVLSFLPFCMAQIVPSTILYPICLNIMPQIKGRITSLMQGGRLILSGLGLQMTGYLYTGSFQEIGVVLLGFMIVAIVGMGFVMRSPEIMKMLRTDKREKNG